MMKPSITVGMASSDTGERGTAAQSITLSIQVLEALEPNAGVWTAEDRTEESLEEALDEPETADDEMAEL